MKYNNVGTKLFVIRAGTVTNGEHTYSIADAFKITKNLVRHPELPLRQIEQMRHLMSSYVWPNGKKGFFVDRTCAWKNNEQDHIRLANLDDIAMVPIKNYKPMRKIDGKWQAISLDRDNVLLREEVKKLKGVG